MLTSIILIGALASTRPASAAITGSIRVASPAGTCQTTTCEAFYRSGCPTELAIKDDAIGASIANIASYAGSNRVFRAQAEIAQPNPQSAVVAIAYISSACDLLSTVHHATIGVAKTIPIPAGTKWIAVTPRITWVMVNVRWSLA